MAGQAPPFPLPTPQFPLVARRDYVVQPTRVVSLCVVDTGQQRQLRLYYWMKKSVTEGWKVRLSNFRLDDIDLLRIGPDALALASEHGVYLRWRPSTSQTASAADAVTDLLNLFDTDSNDVAESSPDTLSCPDCGSDSVAPIVYGIPQPHTENPAVIYGGLSFSAESPLWFCRDCETRFGRVSWT